MEVQLDELRNELWDVWTSYQNDRQWWKQRADKVLGSVLKWLQSSQQLFYRKLTCIFPILGSSAKFLRREVPVQRRAKEDDQRTANPNSRYLFQEIAHLPEVTWRATQHQCTPELSLLTIHELIESECVDCQQFLLVMCLVRWYVVFAIRQCQQISVLS